MAVDHEAALNTEAILSDPWLSWEGYSEPADGDDARRSRCIYIGCSDCRTVFMGRQKHALLAALATADAHCEDLFDDNWNRYVVPGGGASFSKCFKDWQRDRRRVAFLVQHQLHGGETLVAVTHRNCGWVKKYQPDMSFAQAAVATVEAMQEFQAELARAHKSVRTLVVADRLHADISQRYKVVADLNPLLQHQTIG